MLLRRVYEWRAALPSSTHTTFFLFDQYGFSSSNPYTYDEVAKYLDFPVEVQA